MTDHGLRTVAVARQLREALDETARALTTADLNGLLHSESRLELAVRKAITASSDLSAEDRRAVREEVDRARRVLRQCRRAGDALLDMVRLTFEAQGRTSGYGPSDIQPLVPAPRLTTRA